LSESLHDAQQPDEGHWTATPGNRTGNLPAGTCPSKVTADRREAAIGRRKSDDHQRTVSQRGRYDHDRRPTRIPAIEPIKVPSSHSNKNPPRGARLEAKRDCRAAAAVVPRQGYQPTGESFLDPDPPINRPDQQADRKRRKPRDPRHAPSLTDDRLLEPLTTAIQDLARRARIDLDASTEPVQLGQGKTNPQIAAALFISPRTAGVHVTHILRKLDATTRVQAATIAERAGLLAADQAEGLPAKS
jgi:Bacterial regulatory proteins, luxR family